MLRGEQGRVTVCKLNVLIVDLLEFNKSDEQILQHFEAFFEDLVTFKLEFNDGLEPGSILMQQVETNDVCHETFGAQMFGKEWIVGRSTVRPFLNCLSWDNEELVEAVRSKILPPSNLPYNFTVPLEELPATSLFGEVDLFRLLLPWC